MCVCVSKHSWGGVGKRDVLNERQNTHTHGHPHTPSSISAAVSPHFAPCCLLSMFIWRRAPWIGPCVKLLHTLLLAFTSNFLGEIKATPGRFTAFTTIFYYVVFLSIRSLPSYGGGSFYIGPLVALKKYSGSQSSTLKNKSCSLLCCDL